MLFSNFYSDDTLFIYRSELLLHKVVPFHTERITVNIHTVAIIITINSRLCWLAIKWDRFLWNNLNFFVRIIIEIVSPIASYDISIRHYVNRLEELLVWII